MSLCAVRSHRLIHHSTNQGSDQTTPLAAVLPPYAVTHSVCAGFLSHLLRSPSRSLLPQFHPRMVLSHSSPCTVLARRRGRRQSSTSSPRYLNNSRSTTLAAGALVAWMSSNRLRLNPSKTQYIWLGTRQQLAKLDL